MRDNPWKRSTGIKRATAVKVAIPAMVFALAGAGCSSTGSTGGGDQANPTTSVGASAKASLKGSVFGVDAAGPPREGGQLVFGMEGEPEGVDPTRYAFSQSGHMVASSVFDPIVTLDEDGNAKPFLAKSFEPNADAKEWTFTIEPGVIFHDGTKLTPEVVKQNLDAYKASLITGAALEPVTSVTTSGDDKVIVKLSRSVRTFPALLTAQAGYMLHPSMLTNADYVRKPLGTGPFVFDSEVKGSYWKLKKNQSYWRKGLPHLEAIEFRPIPDSSERVDKLVQGEIDMIHVARPEQVADLRTKEAKRIEFNGGDEAMLDLNTSKPPFDNRNARLAVASATDAESWRRDQGGNVYGPANSPFAPGQLGYLEDNGYPKFDLNKAKELVAAYEKEAGKKLAFTFLTQQEVDSTAEAQYLVKLYKDAGMDVTVETKPQINLIAAVATGTFEMARFRVFNQTNPDIDAHFWLGRSVKDPISLNFPRFKNQEIDDAIDKARATDDPTVRDESYQTVNKVLGRDVPYIWLGRTAWVLAMSPKVNGAGGAGNGSFQTVGVKSWVGELWKLP